MHLNHTVNSCYLGKISLGKTQTVASVEFIIGWLMDTSFSPSMAAARVAADEEERHPLLASRGGLEEDSFAVATDGAADFLGAGKGGVAGDVLEHLGELSSAVVHHVPVDTVVVCNLLVVAVPAGEEEHLLVPVLLGIQYVVAFTAKLHGTHGCCWVGERDLLSADSMLLSLKSEIFATLGVELRPIPYPLQESGWS